MCKPIVQRATDNGKRCGRRQPKGLPECLLLLRLVSAYDCHVCCWDDALEEAEKEALDVEASPACYPSSGHAACRPDDDKCTENTSKVEALEWKRHWIQSSQHAEVEQRGSPGEAGSVDYWRLGGRVRYTQGEIGGHAKQNCVPKDCLVELACISAVEGRDEPYHNSRSHSLTIRQTFITKWA